MPADPKEIICDLPPVPAEKRPRRLPHAETLSLEISERLVEFGWAPTDVRLMPSDNVDQRRDVVLAWLEGVRLGTISPDQRQVKFIELEARLCGLYTGKETPKGKESIDNKTLDELMQYGNNTGTWQPTSEK